ncbi:hypothetical protein [uncultured Methanobrevibacter sp.]|uniref:hypothetical protein n=1 Tax=uncultured Methanobrevibacter sp. TaxID=253161 RepID=UPI0025F1CA71|nr:hypothetical protein [uncultured Methanobrevibacter sp.]
MGKEASPDFENKVSLKINDIDIELNEFADEIIKETIFGMVRAIKTANIEIRNLKIEINNE